MRHIKLYENFETKVPIIIYSDTVETIEVIAIQGEEVTLQYTEYGEVYKVETKNIKQLSKDAQEKVKASSNENVSEPDNKLPNSLINEINVAFENTVLCARTNSPQESYDYAQRMANMIIKKIEQLKSK